MTGPLPVGRNERATSARGGLAAPRGSAEPPPSNADADGQQQIAAQHQAFDFEAAERAEILREHEVLQTMLMAHLKNDALRSFATRRALIQAADHIRDAVGPLS